MINQQGLSLIELIVVVAIVGILSTIGFLNIRRDTPQVREAARITAADMSRARTEAIRLNTRVAFLFDPTTNSYRVFEDANRDRTSDTGKDIFARNFSSEFPLADLSATNFTNDAVWFDARGLPHNSTGGFVNGTINFTSVQNTTYALSVVLFRQGRIRVN